MIKIKLANSSSYANFLVWKGWPFQSLIVWLIGFWCEKWSLNLIIYLSKLWLLLNETNPSLNDFYFAKFFSLQESRFNVENFDLFFLSVTYLSLLSWLSLSVRLKWLRYSLSVTFSLLTSFDRKWFDSTLIFNLTRSLDAIKRNECNKFEFCRLFLPSNLIQFDSIQEAIFSPRRCLNWSLAQTEPDSK